MAVIQDFSKSRERGHLPWRAAGKNDGAGACCDREGVFRLPVDDPNDDPADGEREVTTPWIHCNNEWALAEHPPSGDIWAEGNLGKEEVVGNVVEEPAWWDKYGLPMLPSAAAGWGGGACPPVEIGTIAEYEGGGVWRARNRGNEWRDRGLR